MTADSSHARAALRRLLVLEFELPESEVYEAWQRMSGFAAAALLERGRQVASSYEPEPQPSAAEQLCYDHAVDWNCIDGEIVATVEGQHLVTVPLAQLRPISDPASN